MLPGLVHSREMDEYQRDMEWTETSLKDKLVDGSWSFFGRRRGAEVSLEEETAAETRYCLSQVVFL